MCSSKDPRIPRPPTGTCAVCDFLSDSFDEVTDRLAFTQRVLDKSSLTPPGYQLQLLPTVSFEEQRTKDLTDRILDLILQDLLVI